MTQWQELVEKAKARFGEAETILKNDEAKPEEKAKVESLMKEAQDLKDRAQKLKTVAEMAEEMGVANEKAAHPEAKNRQNDVRKEFANWGEFVSALAMAHKYRKVDPRLKRFVDKDEDAIADSAGRATQRKDLSDHAGASGGFLVPVENYDELMAVAAPMSIIRPRATIIRMSRRQMNIPVLNQTGTTTNQPSFFGGMQARWADSGQLANESEPTFRQATLTAHKLLIYTEVEEELMNDSSVALADFLGGPLGMPGIIAWMEDFAFLRGTGVGQPQGIVNAPGSVVVARNTASTVVYADLVKMLSHAYGDDLVWVATVEMKETLLNMTGPSGNPSYLWGNAENGTPNMLLGHPIIFVDKLPGVGTQGDIMLADFTYYIIGDRRATTVEMSEHYKFQNDKMVFRGKHRVDGQPWISAPITLTSAGNHQISPFVVLGDAAT